MFLHRWLYLSTFLLKEPTVHELFELVYRRDENTEEIRSTATCLLKLCMYDMMYSRKVMEEFLLFYRSLIEKRSTYP